MLDILLATIGALALALGLGSEPLRRLPLTEPLAALLLGVLLGPALLGVVVLEPTSEVPVLQVAARIVLALSVMGVALRFGADEIRPHLGGIVLLVSVVLLGMALVTAGLAARLLAAPAGLAFLLGAILAPTDPVLASSVVAGEPARRDLPARIRILLSIESGANDGLAFPLVLLGLVAAAGSALGAGLLDAGGRLAITLPVGAGIGWVAGRLVLASERHHDMEHSSFLVLTLALALSVLGTVDAVGGIGVLGVFVAGLAYNAAIEQAERYEEWEVQEAINRYLVLPVFTLFGALLPWDGWVALGWGGVAFVGAVILIRRLPLVLLGAPLLGVGPAGAGFLGWFGPIGVAALLYLTEARKEGLLGEAGWAAGTLVVAASTLLHGMTAAPCRHWYRAREEKRSPR